MKKLLLNTRLSLRLAAGFGLVLCLLLLITGVALQRMQTMQAQTQQIVEVSNERMARAQAMMNAANDAAVALYGFMLISDEIDGKAQQQLYDGAMARYAAADKGLRALLGADADLKKLDDAATAAGSFGRNIGRMVASGGDVGATMRSMDPRQVLDEWRKEIVALVDAESAAGKESYEQAQSTFRVARIVLVVAALVGCALGAAAALLILRSVTRPLARAIAHARRIATGDLRSEIESEAQDETGDLMQALAQMQEQLRGVVGAIRDSTDGITHASGEIAQGNLDLSNRTESAASNLEQTAAAVQDLSDTVHKNAESARTAHELVHATAEAAAKGGGVVGQVVATMGEINSSSRQIADITGVIDGIAFQTNILALNAAVEAARAGEQGRGFAVVAAEVRMLAQRAATAAKDIKALTGGSVSKIDAGSKLAADAGTSMSEIVASVDRVTSMISAISTAATEQSRSIGQVNAAITQLDQMTQQNAALVEQSAAAAESLKQQALALAGVVSTFSID